MQHTGNTVRPIIRIDENSGIPLYGCIAFGLIDRGTNIIQVRPSSSCLLSCIFCSTDAGPKSRWRQVEYIVDLDYLISEIRNLVKYKGGKNIEAHIDTVGDPLTYPHIVELVQKLSEIKGIKVISMQTHGILLTEHLIDELSDSGLSRLNLSIDALDTSLAKKLADSCLYNVNYVKEMAEYVAASSNIDLLIAPVWLSPINDSEMPKIISYALAIGAGKRWPPLGIQKYEVHKYGRKPKGVKRLTWYHFYRKLKLWEEKFKVKLKLSPEDFNIIKLPKLPIMFKRFEKVKARTIAPGWLKGQKLAIAKSRVITLVNAGEIPLEHKVTVRLLRVKDNIYIGEAV